MNDKEAQNLQTKKSLPTPIPTPASKSALTPKQQPVVDDKEFVALGVHRITRHPAFAGLGFIGLGQMLLATTAPAYFFWGGFPVFYLIGCAHQDYRKKMDPANAKLYQQSSLLPFQAIIQGNNKLRPDELSWQTLLGSTAATAVIYAARIIRK